MYIILFARETAVRKPQLCIHDNDDVIIKIYAFVYPTPKLELGVIELCTGCARIRTIERETFSKPSAVPSRDCIMIVMVYNSSCSTL